MVGNHLSQVSHHTHHSKATIHHHSKAIQFIRHHKAAIPHKLNIHIPRQVVFNNLVFNNLVFNNLVFNSLAFNSLVFNLKEILAVDSYHHRKGQSVVIMMQLLTMTQKTQKV
jgi:hypothetical protein